MRRLVPSPSGHSRPHMILPTGGRVNAVYDLLVLLIKLEVVTNGDVLAIPSYESGNTYYHVPARNALLSLLNKLKVQT